MSGSDATPEALKLDPDGAPLSARERAIVDYALKLTREPWTAREADVEHLRAVGLDDLGILHVVTFTGWFNYINRVADGLGVELDQDTWEALCKQAPIPWELESGSTRPGGAPGRI